jgi:hypothetical protein
MTSEHGQDHWIIGTVLRAELAAGYRGFFVEAGAADGLVGSNTAALERDHGWTGLLVEPNREFFSRCAANRPGATVVRAVLSADDGEIEFIEAGYLGAAPDHVLPVFERLGLDLDSHPNYQLDADGRPARRGLLPARSLRSLLAEIDAPTFIDYLSLDVEGSELQALQGFPFNTHALGALSLEACFEHAGVRYDHAHRQPCRDLLEHHGYRRVGTAGFDDLYLPRT